MGVLPAAWHSPSKWFSFSLHFSSRVSRLSTAPPGSITRAAFLQSLFSAYFACVRIHVRRIPIDIPSKINKSHCAGEHIPLLEIIHAALCIFVLLGVPPPA
ncbi:hypothetical protein B0H10DRAFT_2228615 [Mycena sp. CBHHK59/15]|nr:hypothetical protein B0H10DRAFT_2228615 [Mycena sp. CBHHK59/15]